jgi:hypothetical protein
MTEDDREKELRAEAGRLQDRVASRLAWCEANPREAAQIYGVDVIVGDRGPAAGRPLFECAAAPLHTWTEAIAREICPEGWRWNILNTGSGRPVFVLTAYTPSPPPEWPK